MSNTCFTPTPCVAAAKALRYDAVVVTEDPEFQKLEKIVSVEWI
jgi:predicted nucleic acid-binding protein